VLDRGDGRVVVGGTMEEQGFDTRVTVDGVYRLLEAAWEVLPDVSELEFDGARAGLRPGTPDNLPVIGRGEQTNLIWATGHYRNGVLLTPITAQAVADLLTGNEPPAAVRPFTPERFGVAVR
jgi:glycine oxidase